MKAVGRRYWFYALSVIADEVSTFVILSLGGVELNARVAQIINVHPLLYPVADLLLFLALVILDRFLKKNLGHAYTYVVIVAAGLVRLFFFLWNVAQIILYS